MKSITLRGIEEEIKYPIYNDLDYLAGSWSREDEEEFNKSTALFNKVDEDIWIAACALQNGLSLFTLDIHFNKIEGLLLKTDY